MRKNLEFEISPQPSETTCGPSCLHAVYRYYGNSIPLPRVVNEVIALEGGGTLAVFLACHSLRQGYAATIFTYDLNIFDPTWFTQIGTDIKKKLAARSEAKKISKLTTAISGYIEFLELGGVLRFEDLTTSLIRKYLNRDAPIITGLSSTYLYRSPREIGYEGSDDDIGGDPAGHFVVLCGYDRNLRTVSIADPFVSNPIASRTLYEINIDRVLCSILLGAFTYDANLLVIRPKKERK